MTYFVICMSANCINVPKLIDWESVVSRETLQKNELLLIPERTCITAHSDKNTVYPDLLTFPFPMVSKTLRKVIQLYEADTIFKEIILIDGEKQLHQYYIPILEEVKCLHPDSVHAPGNLKRVVIWQPRVGQRSIFIIRRASDRFVVGNLDFVESMFRRGVIGVDLIQTETRI